MGLRSIAARAAGPLTMWRLAIAERTLNGLRHWAPNPIERMCPICGFNGYFRGFGWPVRPEAQCPQRRSLERHRLFAIWAARNEVKLRGKRILHFAPEASIKNVVAAGAAAYITADISPGADLTLDIENMAGIADGSYDVVVCFHVLEHVNDDRKALREIRRVLSPGGFALLMTPVIEGWERTYENPSITDPQMRWVHFDQDDHVRVYGADFRSRVREAGFMLDEFTAVEPLICNHGLIRADKLFIASRS